MHALSHRLHPSLLDELGLEEALRAEVARFGDAESIGVDLEVEVCECAVARTPRCASTGSPRRR